MRHTRSQGATKPPCEAEARGGSTIFMRGLVIGKESRRSSATVGGSRAFRGPHSRWKQRDDLKRTEHRAQHRPR